MHSYKKMLWTIVVIALILSVLVALKTSSFDNKNSSPRGTLVKRIDYYGC